MKTYPIHKINPNLLQINGNTSHYLWEKAAVLKDFSSPWHCEDNEDIEFRALHDGEKLYLSYRVYDVSLHIESNDNSKKSIDESDRVELFMRADEHLNPYYCLEIDPLGRVQDFMARPNHQFDFSWNWPKEDIVITSNISPEWFTVELSLTIASLQRYNLIQNGRMEAGIYRAKYTQLPNGQFEPIWITWVDPGTETPNFHTAASFGVFTFEDLANTGN